MILYFYITLSYFINFHFIRKMKITDNKLSIVIKDFTIGLNQQ